MDRTPERRTIAMPNASAKVVRSLATLEQVLVRDDDQVST
jgi:hypothetical protein